MNKIKEVVLGSFAIKIPFMAHPLFNKCEGEDGTIGFYKDIKIKLYTDELNVYFLDNFKSISHSMSMEELVELGLGLFSDWCDKEMSEDSIKGALIGETLYLDMTDKGLNEFIGL